VLAGHHIHDLQLLDWPGAGSVLDVRCTKGAYIRVLAEDLAAQLDHRSFGRLAPYRRPRVCRRAAVVFRALESLSVIAAPRGPADVDAPWGLRRFDLPVGGSTRVRRARPSVLLGKSPGLPGTVRIYAEGLGFLGWGKIEAAGLLKPLRLISSAANRVEGRCPDAYNARLLKSPKY